jgi:hypothetical protein
MKPLLKLSLTRLTIVTVTFIVGILVGVFLFSQSVHEDGHAIACWFFKVPFVYSTSHVDTIPLTGIPNIVIGLAGGLFEALVALFFFLLMTVIEKQKGKWFWGAVGFEIPFLAIVLTGLVNAVWEGFFTLNYKLNFDNSTAVFMLFGSTLVLSALILMVKKRLGKRIFSSSPLD